MKKVILITNVPTPYRVPLFVRIDKAFSEVGWELTVVFGARNYSRRKYKLEADDFGFKHLFLDGGLKQDSTNPESTVFLYKGLMGKLREMNPDHVIVSGFSPATLRVWWWSLQYKRSFSIWSGTVPGRGSTFGFLRTLLRGYLARCASGFIAYGTEAKRYLQGLGVNENKIDVATNTVDTVFFREQTALCRNHVPRESQRVFTFTYVGYLVPRKKVEQILHAAAQLAVTRKDFRILIIGDGPLRDSLESLARELHVAEFVQFQGHKQTSDLPSILAQTDVFLFQTGFDIWGLVLNEAMAAGLACIASTNAGATTDLIEDGANGFRMDYNRINLLTERMNWCIEHPDDVRSMGLKASKDVEDLAGLDKAVRIFITHTLKVSRTNA